MFIEHIWNCRLLDLYLWSMISAATWRLILLRRVIESFSVNQFVVGYSWDKMINIVITIPVSSKIKRKNKRAINLRIECCRDAGYWYTKDRKEQVPHRDTDIQTGATLTITTPQFLLLCFVYQWVASPHHFLFYKTLYSLGNVKYITYFLLLYIVCSC